jgi:glycine/D-amino acid oxidase-like deaminating enzyme
MNRHLFQSRPMEAIDPAWPFIWDVNRGLYFRPESGGLLLCPCDETPAEPGDYSEDPAMLEDLAEKLSSLQPALSELSILTGWVGQRVFTPDRRFVIGFDHRDHRVFHVAALGGHGVTASYAVGKMAAQLLLGQPADHALPFDPSRFA